MSAPDEALHAPATTRNREPILAVLREVLPARGTVLEVASGTGEHAAYFAAALPELTWQPSDREPSALGSIAAHRARVGVPNLAAPLHLDLVGTWPVVAADALVAINMIHISPWEATLALFAGASRVLPSGAPLVTYGPYRVGGGHIAPSNEAFDASLRARDPQWGVRDVEEVGAVADEAGFSLERRVAMPANNFTLVFRRR